MVLAGVIALASAGLVAAVFAPAPDEGPPPLAARVRPKLADLSLAPLVQITPGLREDGRRFLRFGVTIVNVGAGEFLVNARRSHFLASDWKVEQRVPEADGGYTRHDTPATLVYGGDGHDHWHIREVEAHRLERTDGTVVGQVIKSGFCFFDTTEFAPDLRDAAPAKVHRSQSCGGQFDSRSSMGLSIGWGDEYPWHLLDQQIDITGLPDGRYRLRAIADPFHWFDELDETNNEVWTDIELSLDGDMPVVKIIGSSTR